MKVELNLNFNAMMIASMLILVLAFAGVVGIVVHHKHCSQCQHTTTSTQNEATEEVIKP